MKFTEEQYQKIVETVNKYQDFGCFYYVQNGWVESKPTDTFNELIEALSHTVSGESEVNRMLALANPLTREWAHDKFVEKEKKYLWSSKKIDKDNNVLTLYKDEEGMVSTSYRKVSESNLRNEDNWITESEIKAWGYNPDMFDREEIQ
ncbi:hypothetical protein [Leuconostoc pseudomesenteroides]|uniref:hypothetical protein n=1 Tax=Leuconostoc pseudomesenteroides TaxID=33968 RepID=UPI0039EB2A72